MIQSNSKTRRNNYDWITIMIYIVLTILGFLSIHSASYNDAIEYGLNQRSGMQLLWVCLSYFVAGVILFMRKEFFFQISIPLYFFAIILLFLMIFLGKEVNGARSWISIGNFSIQPAEFGKFITSMMLARIVSDYNFDITSFRGSLKAIFIILLPMVMIVMQNDTGSAVVYTSFGIVLYIFGFNSMIYKSAFVFIILFILSMILDKIVLLWLIIVIIATVLSIRHNKYVESLRYISLCLIIYVLLYLGIWWRGIDVNSEYLLLISVALSLIIPIYKSILSNSFYIYKYVSYFVISYLYIGFIRYIFDNVIQLHQQKRILDLLGLESDLRGWGYNVNQSMIAIGSGGFYGKGYMNGSQTKYDFVPEQTTDFIFCTIGEEGGFIMTTLTVILFGALILRLIRIAIRINDNFAKIYTFGVISLISAHVIVNIGMTIGLLPVIGIPLPFISYGGSSILSFTIMLFIAIKLCSEDKIGIRRY